MPAPPQAAVPAVTVVVSLRRGGPRGWLRLRDGMGRLRGYGHACPDVAILDRYSSKYCNRPHQTRHR